MGAGVLASTPLLAYLHQQKALKISLAQWSLHRSFNDKILDPHDFASISMEKYGIEAVEYVNGFYHDKATDEAFWNKMKARSEKAGVTNLVIMVDDEGDLGNAYFTLHAAWAVDDVYMCVGSIVRCGDLQCG